MGTPSDKHRLFGLLYEAKEAVADEKAAAFDRFHAELDRVRTGTMFPRQQVKDLLIKDGYWEYAKRRRITERGS